MYKNINITKQFLRMKYINNAIYLAILLIYSILSVSDVPASNSGAAMLDVKVTDLTA